MNKQVQRKNITIFSSLVAIFLLLVSGTGSLQKVVFATAWSSETLKPASSQNSTQGIWRIGSPRLSIITSRRNDGINSQSVSKLLLAVKPQPNM